MFQKISPITLIAVVVLGMVLTYATAGFVSISEAVPSTNRAVASSGSIRTLNVGVYSDYACSQSLSSLDWGDVSPGDSVKRTIYVKNTGSAEISLSMSTTGWNPAEANGPLTLSWNQEGTKLNAGEVVAATLTLGVLESITNITTFSVQILISGYTF